MTDRVFPLEGIHNFRRFGGYETTDGRRVSDRLYRSGQFSRATEADKAALDALNIKVVADLRRPRERESEPSYWPERANVTVLASDHAGAKEPPHLVFMRDSDMSLESIRHFMTQTYRALPFDEGNKWVFEQGFRALADADEDHGFVVHCAAGKDRTGLFCALLLWELGVADDIVHADYLMTNTAVDFDRIIPAIRTRMKQGMAREVGETEMRAFLGVEPGYMTAALDAMGDPREYLRSELGLEDEVLSKVRARLIS